MSAMTMTKEEEAFRQKYKRRLERMKANKGQWDNHWELVSRFVLARKNNIYGSRIQGDERNEFIYDSTPVHSNEILASALNGMFVSSVEQWLEFMTGDTELDKEPEVRLWLQDAALKVLRAYGESNFYSETHEMFLDLGCVRTSTFYQEESEEGGLKFLCRPIYMFSIEQDVFKNITAVCAEYEFTWFQLLDYYGEEAIPDEVRARYASNKREDGCRDMFTVYVFIEKNSMYNKDDGNSRRYSAIHILEKTFTKLQEKGYHEFPYAIPRWTLTQDELYGRSPAMKVLPDILLLNQVMFSHLKIIQKMGDPIMQAPSDSFLMPMRTSPGSWNYYRSGSQDRIEPVAFNARPDVSKDFINDIRARIQRGFFIDQLQMMEGPQKTATEVMQRREEQSRIIGPVVSRLYSDFVVPTVERTVSIFQRRGDIFMPLPDKLQGRELRIKMVSQIAKAQKASQADSFSRVIQASMAAIEADPASIGKIFDVREVIRIHADIFNLPETMMKPEDEVLQEEAAQAEAMAQMQQAEIEKTDAAAAKDNAMATQAMSQEGGEGGGQVA